MIEESGPGLRYLEPTFAVSSAAKNRICPASFIFCNVNCSNGRMARWSPAVKTIWSTLPVCSNNFSRFFSTSSLPRSQVKPRTESEADGYEDLRLEIAESIVLCLEEEIVTRANDSMLASALYLWSVEVFLMSCD